MYPRLGTPALRQQFSDGWNENLHKTKILQRKPTWSAGVITQQHYCLSVTANTWHRTRKTRPITQLFFECRSTAISATSPSWTLRCLVAGNHRKRRMRVCPVKANDRKIGNASLRYNMLCKDALPMLLKWTQIEHVCFKWFISYNSQFSSSCWPLSILGQTNFRRATL